MVFLNNKIRSILGNNKFSRINFIICGTQRGGTTALDSYLRTHSDICMADKKEVHYFDIDAESEEHAEKIIRTEYPKSHGFEIDCVNRYIGT